MKRGGRSPRIAIRGLRAEAFLKRGRGYTGLDGSGEPRYTDHLILRDKKAFEAGEAEKELEERLKQEKK